MVTMGNEIASLRKQKGMTQEALANELGVSNQAVSKWEADQCCPDIQLLPKLADLFEVSIDHLFGREERKRTENVYGKLPWENDNTLRVVAFVGHILQAFQVPENAEDMHVVYDGEVADVKSCISVQCGDVNGDIEAGSYVVCESVNGDINAGAWVECENVTGDITANAHVGIEGGNIEGDVTAGAHVSVEGGNIEGDVTAGAHVVVEGGNIEGDVTAGSHVICGQIDEYIDAGI